MRWIRATTGSLTTRGRSFVAAGAAAGVSAFALGQRDLLRIGILLIVLPLGCAIAVGRAQLRLALTRTITPSRVMAGAVAKVRLELENLTRLVTRVLLAEDTVPYVLGPSPRFVLAPLPSGRRAAVTYSLHTQVRGRYPVGPLRLRVADPFGLCEVTRAFTETDPLVVVPQTWPLVGNPAGGQWGGTGEAIAGTAAASGEHDVAIREYRHGDDLRRVHWRSTARRGELMVRRDEQPRQMRATILLDCRREAHRGEGLGSSFEWAVSAAASVAVHLTDQRYAVRLLIDEPSTSWTSPRGATATGLLLDRLALAQLSDSDGLAAAAAALQHSHGDGLIVAVLGEVSEGAARAIADLRNPGTSAVALLLRVPQWAPRSSPVPAASDGVRERAAAVFATAGWIVTEVAVADSVPAAWRRAMASGAALPVGGRA